MKFNILIFIIKIFFSKASFIPNILPLMIKEMYILNNLILENNLPCHLVSSRIKTFESSIYKLNKYKIKDIYNIHDLIGFRFVFYNKEDLLKYYHILKSERSIMYTKNYINEPKKNNYKAFHIRYQNPDFNNCPIKQLECQLFIIDNYYDAIYGNAQYNKNYTLLF